MQAFEMLDVLIGLMTIYLSFGIACTAIVEAVSAWFGVRSRHLEDGLKEFLAGCSADKEQFVDAFYAHPLIQALSKGENGRPSYIPRETVARVVESLLRGTDMARNLPEAVAALPGTTADNRIKGLLDDLLIQAKDDAAEFRQLVEAQFDQTMNRVSGWFKRYTQHTAAAAAAVLVLGGNVDTLTLMSALASNPETRQQLVLMAEQQVSSSERVVSASGEEGLVAAQAALEQARWKLDQAVVNAQSAGLPLGWQQCPDSFTGWLAKLVGLLISICAISLGAPFWFDLLNRVMQLRTAGGQPSVSGQQTVSGQQAVSGQVPASGQ